MEKEGNKTDDLNVGSDSIKTNGVGGTPVKKKKKSWLLKFNRFFYRIFNKDYIPLYTVISFMFALTLPFLFTRTWLGYIFEFGTGTGPIGDTIGGITAPVIGLFSAILVYFAFKAQIKANKLQRKSIRKQVKDNAFAHEVELIKYNIEKLTEFMNGNPESYIIWHPRQENSTYIYYCTKGTIGTKELPSTTNLLLQFYWSNIITNKDFRNLIISDELSADNERHENSNNFTSIISLLNNQLYTFIYLYTFSIKNHALLLNECNEINLKNPRFHIVYNLFSIIELSYLNYYSWLTSSMLKTEQSPIYLGRMDNGEPNYQRLIERIKLVKEFRDKANKLFKEYDKLVKDEVSLSKENKE